MPDSIDVIFIVFSTLVILSIFTIKLSNRFGIPSLVLFLAIGMLAGSDGLGGITFDNPSLVRSLGITALVLILFSGGLDTEWAAIRPIVWQGLSLSTIGVLVTALLIGVFVSWGPGVLIPGGALARRRGVVHRCSGRLHGAPGEENQDPPAIDPIARI
ncbi:MAG TPA: cation:proton antiporter [Nitrospiraceae bacterium]|nr:cation:proton antiporter [Nitrospiraceae bacterium]